MENFSTVIGSISSVCGNYPFSEAVTEAATVIFSERPLLETVVFVDGHRNSDGEPAPWVIKSRKNRKIISSHKSKADAEKHLAQMQYFKKVNG